MKKCLRLFNALEGKQALKPLESQCPTTPDPDPLPYPLSAGRAGRRARRH